MLILDSGKLLSMGLPDSSRPITIVIVGVMMAIRWLEAKVRENKRQKAPTREQLQKLDCLKDLDLFETMCKILNIPMEVKKIWERRLLMPWFRANMTGWLYEYAKKLRQSVQCVSAGHWGRSFQASFRDSSECSDHRCEEKI